MLTNLIVGKSYQFSRAVFIFFLLLIPSVFFLTNEPIWDDPFVLELHAHWNWAALLGPYRAPDPYWRPLTVLAIALPNLLGLSVLVNKLISVLLFFVQGVLALNLVDCQTRERKSARDNLPLIALAALMALHPIFVETTLWISARADLLLGIFILGAMLWVVRLQDRQASHLAPPSVPQGVLIGFTLVWLACAAKDTGVVWTGLLGVALSILTIQSKTLWRQYWLGGLLGTVGASLCYFAIRMFVLGPTTAVARQISGPLDRVEIVAEFLVRAFLAIFFPYADHGPFRSAGWLTGYCLAALILIIVMALACSALLLAWIYRKNRTSAYLALCAVLVIIFHALLESFSDPTVGSILSDRYLAPSAMLIFVALAIALFYAPAGERTGLNKLVVTVFALLLVQSVLLWTDVRVNWVSNLTLWEDASKKNPTSKVVAEAYSRTLYHSGDFVAARRVARTWLDQHPATPAPTERCTIYLRLLQADSKLGAVAEGMHDAREAMPIGWCQPELTQQIADYLLKTDCTEILALIDKALVQGDKLIGMGDWKFSTSNQKNQLLLRKADAETRCGDPGKRSK